MTYTYPYISQSENEWARNETLRLAGIFSRKYPEMGITFQIIDAGYALGHGLYFYVGKLPDIRSYFAGNIIDIAKYPENTACNHFSNVIAKEFEIMKQENIKMEDQEKRLQRAAVDGDMHATWLLEIQPNITTRTLRQIEKWAAKVSGYGDVDAFAEYVNGFENRWESYQSSNNMKPVTTKAVTLSPYGGPVMDLTNSKEHTY